MNISEHPILAAALSKVIEADTLSKVRDQYEDGNVEINKTVKIKVHGTISVGKSAETEQVTKLCTWKLIAVCFNKLNAATIDSIVREALAMDEKESKALKDKASAAIRELAGTTKQTRAGGLKWSGIVEVK